jgi:hypothetical protein
MLIAATNLASQVNAVWPNKQAITFSLIDIQAPTMERQPDSSTPVNLIFLLPCQI